MSDEAVGDKGTGEDGKGFPVAWRGQERMRHMHNPPDLRDLGTRELRFQTTGVIGALTQGDWLRISHYGTKIGGIIRLDDLEFLTRIGDAATVDDLMAALVEWKRCGPTAPLVGALNTLKAEAKAGGAVGYVRRLGDFEHCQPSPSEVAAPRSVEFGDAELPSGQFALAGSADGRTFLHGFIERADLNAKFLLELPNGETISDFDEDGATLNLRRTPLSSPICLHDIRVRKQ
ncbi:hypothetical protein [Magnetospirillum sp. 15-1]|uniref:hypothetical protein n=1 Tax=Magnetospirillum sp. 15-1 TaxID=1979370 RepID=UPI0011438A24|nr:hypothetical protein [Magnetospirillum sp. 15-1]